jgi:hypothetical protein
MKQLTLAAALALAACATAPAGATQPPACPPQGYDRPALDALKANQWTIADDTARNAFAWTLLPCLGDADPALRDGVAFEALQHYMRNNQLTSETLAQINAELQSMIAAQDPQGFRAPFAALVLSEVARTDRVAPWMTAEQRAELVNASVAYMRAITDHRGFIPGEGYRHAVAHAGDLMLQLVLNQNVDRAQLTQIRDAITAQVSPAEHFYINGESERLARPILYMAQRNVFTEAEWTAWLTALTGDEASWRDWYLSNAGLARRHNLTAFVSTIYINARLSGQDAFAPLLPGAEAAIRALP